ncbi:hypothetical protein OH76DRAFT_24014 [Lentinus brumalis]|uniref:Uncharacterized protein n=1 Tax=Lentinus brumalis TaxID=2498619 RepID=A0A371DXE3_9APHY|nr:hypothetical protein OH76DRAFT_24014 [Polyporus brumalis]
MHATDTRASMHVLCTPPVSVSHLVHGVPWSTSRRSCCTSTQRTLRRKRHGEEPTICILCIARHLNRSLCARRRMARPQRQKASSMSNRSLYALARPPVLVHMTIYLCRHVNIDDSASRRVAEPRRHRPPRLPPFEDSASVLHSTSQSVTAICPTDVRPPKMRRASIPTPCSLPQRSRSIRRCDRRAGNSVACLASSLEVTEQ